MGKAKRIAYFFKGLVMIIASLIMFAWPEEGYLVVLFILEMTLLIHGIQKIWYYFSMARFMVGGINIFYRGLLIFDAGLFTLNLRNMPPIVTMLYLIAVMLFSGVINVAKANETRKQKSIHWKYSMFSGGVKILVAIVCIFHLHSAEIITTIYSIGLFCSAVSHIVTSFRKTAIVYVQ